jgi:hypothetical protein
MGIVMLHLADRLAVPRCVLRGEVTRVQIAREFRRSQVVQRSEAPDDFLKRFHRWSSLQVTDVLADEHLASDGRRDRVLLVSPNGQQRRTLTWRLNRQWSEPTGAPQHQLTSSDFTHDRVIDMAKDRPVMDQE